MDMIAVVTSRCPFPHAEVRQRLNHSGRRVTVTASTRTTTGAREQRLRLSIGALGLVCLLAGDARAADEDCPYWFPDFSCDRQARPDGSVMPMSTPFLFEDPYITTGLNFVGIWNEYSQYPYLQRRILFARSSRFPLTTI